MPGRVKEQRRSWNKVRRVGGSKGGRVTCSPACRILIFTLREMESIEGF